MGLMMGILIFPSFDFCFCSTGQSNATPGGVVKFHVSFSSAILPL